MNMHESFEYKEREITPVSRENFDEQFSEFQTVEINGKEVRYAKVENAENPDAEWFVYIGGFSQGKEIYAEALYDVVASGRNILYLNPLEGIPLENEELREEMDALEVPEIMADKANEVRLILDELGIANADIGGHSQGATVGATLAAMDHGKVGKMLLDSPPGLRGGDNIVRLQLSTIFGKHELVGEMKDLADELESGVEQKVGENDEMYKERLTDMAHRVEVLDVMGETNELKERLIWRLTKEAASLSSFKMTPVIERVKQLQGGEYRDAKTNEISIIMANKDRTFEPDKTLETVGNVVEDPDALVDSMAMYPSKDESHNAPIFAPAGYYTQKLDQ